MKKKIKILYTIPNFDTAGSGRALLNLASGLRPDIFESHIMCMHDRGEFFKNVKASGIPVHIAEYTSQMKPYLRGLLKCLAIARIFRDIRPDIIHSFHYSADYSEAFAARLAGIKWVYTKKNMSWGGSSANAWKMRSLLADAIVAQNTDMLKDFFATSKKVKLIPRGVNSQHFAPKAIDLSLKMQLGFEREDRLIICVANLVPVKGVETLIEAFTKVKHKLPGWKLLIVGDNNNNYGRDLINSVERSGMTKEICFTGKVLNVIDYLNMAEIFILPTLNEGRKEGSPVSLLEAMSNGKVVLGSAVPGIKDQLRSFPSLLFEPGNTEQLAHKIVQYCQTGEEEINQLRQNLIQEVHLKFTIEREINEHSELYTTLLKY